MANAIIEPEFNEMVPENVAVLAARMNIKGARPSDSFVDQLRKTVLDAEDAAKQLAYSKPDVITFGCTSASYVMNVEKQDWDEKIAQTISRFVRIPVITTATAVIRALRCLGIRSIALGTPYPNEVNEFAKRFFESKGFKVIRVGSVPEKNSCNSTSAYNLGKSLDGDDIDGMLLSCTGFKTVDIIDKLEKDLGKPIVSSNQAALWASLRIAKIRERISGYGRLLEEIRDLSFSEPP